MPNPNQNVVTQADREAAADLARQVYGSRIANDILDGTIERHHFLDAFAKHRLSASPSRGAVRHPEDQCQECGRAYPAWIAPSPLWNAVMRGGSINGPWKGCECVCSTCFMLAAEEAGIAGDWKVIARKVNVELETVTPSGRVWDDAQDLWVEPSSGAAIPVSATVDVALRRALVASTEDRGPVIPADMKAWHGGDSAPEDWDGGPVLGDDGKMYEPDGWDSQLDWQHGLSKRGLGADIIAYTPKPTIPAEGQREAIALEAGRDGKLIGPAPSRELSEEERQAEISRLVEKIRQAETPTASDDRLREALETILGSGKAGTWAAAVEPLENRRSVHRRLDQLEVLAPRRGDHQDRQDPRQACARRAGKYPRALEVV